MSKTNPKDVNGIVALRAAHYRTRLFELLAGRFDIECDDFVDKGYVIYNLLIRGKIALLRTNEFGVIPLRCNPYGVNVFNLNTHVRAVAPHLPEIIAEIDGPDCVLYHTPRLGDSQNFYSFQYHVDMYANQLAEIDAAISVNLLNSKLAYIAEAESKAQADTIKRLYDEVQEGTPLVVYRSNSGLNMDSAMTMFFNNLKQNYIVDMLLDAKRSIMNEYLTSIGVNNSPIDRKERVTTVETNSNNEELEIALNRFKTILEERNESVGKKFPGTKFSIKLREPKREEARPVDAFRNGVPVGNAGE